MLERLQKNAMPTSIVVVVLYGLWFVLPMFFKEIDPNAHGTVGVEGAMTMWSSEVITATVLFLIVTLLRWWKKIGFKGINKGSFKFLLPVIVLILLLLNLAWVQDDSSRWFLGFDTPSEALALLGVMLLLGFVEEGIFRGILFYGLSTRLTPFYTVLITAFIFGSFHFVNLFTGESFNGVLYQSIHAFSMGFLYASLRLQLGAVWPLMLLHASWDMTLFILQTVGKHTEEADLTLTSGLAISIPALLYGSFVYWRWSKQKSH